MATQYIQFVAAPNRALTVKLYDIASNAEFATAASISEIPNTGVYTATFTGTVLSSDYRLIAIDDITSYGIATYRASFTATDGEKVQASEFHDADSLFGTVANQELILQKISPITTIYTSQPNSSTLELVRGDNYDDISNNVLLWVVSKDVSAATSVNFTIRDMDDNIIIDQSHAGVTTSASGTSVSVTLLNSATSLLPLGDSKFDVEILFTDSHWTVAKGYVCISEDQSRT